jgi:peptidoglycan hydrolase-like protein with peptidoglycan-binding domain
MACERTTRSQLLLAGLVAIAVALSLPTAGHAAESDKLAAAGVLARGSGYESATGSEAVRVLQRRLRRLGSPAGPIDGLYGPLTEGAVERFQRGHGLAVDGIVGRQTKRRLHAAAMHPSATPTHRETQPGTLERKSPAPDTGAESADEPQHARPAPTGVASRAGPERTPEVPPEVVALVIGLSALLLGTLWWKRRRDFEASVNIGLACAALLGVFGIGAAAGAIFATQAAPEGVDQSNAQSGVLLAGAESSPRKPSSPPPRSSVARATRARSPAATLPAPAATPPAPVREGDATARPAPAAARAPIRPAKPAATYVVKPGDSLSDIARSELGAKSSAVSVVEVVEKLTDLNIDTRIQSGDPDLIEAGEELRLP